MSATARLAGLWREQPYADPSSMVSMLYFEGSRQCTIEHHGHYIASLDECTCSSLVLHVSHALAGNSAQTALNARFHITLLNRGEQYNFTSPDFGVRGLLGLIVDCELFNSVTLIWYFPPMRIVGSFEIWCFALQ